MSSSDIAFGVDRFAKKLTYSSAALSRASDVLMPGCCERKSEGLSSPFVWTVEKLYS
jgi:hypothetical protein